MAGFICINLLPILLLFWYCSVKQGTPFPVIGCMKRVRTPLILTIYPMVYYYYYWKTSSTCAASSLHYWCVLHRHQAKKSDRAKYILNYSHYLLAKQRAHFSSLVNNILQLNILFVSSENVIGSGLARRTEILSNYTASSMLLQVKLLTRRQCQSLSSKVAQLPRV